MTMTMARRWQDLMTRWHNLQDPGRAMVASQERSLVI